MNKRLRTLRKEFPGWEPQIRHSGHIRLVHRATGAVYFTAASPSDVRAIRNLRASLRRLERGQAA